MKSSQLIVQCAVVACFPFGAMADYQPAPGERAPTGTIHCSWSELRGDELKLCQDRKRYYDNLTPEEKAAQNSAAGKRGNTTVVVDENSENLRRRTGEGHPVVRPRRPAR